MATYYLDPLGGSDAANGTSTGTAWKTLYWCTAGGNPSALANGDTLLVKADSDWAVSGGQFVGLYLNGKSNVTIGTYGAGAAPRVEYNRDLPATLMSAAEIAGTPLTVMNKWYEVSPDDGVTPRAGTRLWRINIQNYYAGFAYVTFGTAYRPGFRGPYWYKLTDVSPLAFNAYYLPQRDCDWDAREGTDASDPAALLCWAPAPEGPVGYYGRIRWQSAQEPVLLIKDSSGVVVDGLRCQHSAMLAKFVNTASSGSGHILRNCEAADAGGLAALFGGAKGGGVWLSDFKVQANRALRLQGVAINPSLGVKAGIIEGNWMEDCGLVSSQGGIYFGDCYAPSGSEIHVRRNVGIRQRYGKYFLYDGRVVMTDSDSANVWAYGNLAIDSHQAYGSNSGAAGCRWWANISLGCDHGYVESDLLAFSVAGSGSSPSDTIVGNNSFLGCGIRRWYEDDGRQPYATRQVQLANDGAVVLSALPVGTLAQWRVYNNVVTGLGASAQAASAFTVQPETAGHYTLKNNCVNGFGRMLGLFGAAQTVDASNIAVDPRLDGWVPKTGSPLLNAGMDWWTADGKPGLGALGQLHIGASLPAYN